MKQMKNFLIIFFLFVSFFVFSNVAGATTYSMGNNIGFGIDSLGNDWQIFSSNGSNIFDYIESNNNGYKQIDFKIYNYAGYSCSGSCMQLQILSADPRIGVNNTYKILYYDFGTLGIPQNNQNDHLYLVTLTFNNGGIDVYVYDDTNNAIIIDHQQSNFSIANNQFYLIGWNAYISDLVYISNLDNNYHSVNFSDSVYGQGQINRYGGGGVMALTGSVMAVDVPTSDISFISPLIIGNYAGYVPFNGVYNNTAGLYDKLKITIHNNTTSVADSILTKDIVTGSNISFSNEILLLLNQNYTYTAKLYNSSTLDETSSTRPITFNTGTLLIDPNTPPTLNYQNCSITSIGGCFSNALIYLFYPSDLAVNNLYDLKETIKNKPPIGYISGVLTTLGSISATATPTLVFASFTPLNTYVFTPLRSGLIWVLWILFLFLLFKRFSNFQL